MSDYARCLERYGEQLRDWPLWLWPLALLAPLSPGGAACLRAYREREQYWQRQMAGELTPSTALQQRLADIPAAHRQPQDSRLPLWSAGVATTAALVLGLAVGISDLPGQYALFDDEYQAFAELDFTGSLDVDTWLEEEQ